MVRVTSRGGKNCWFCCLSLIGNLIEESILMNNGKLIKRFYSPDSAVAQLIEDAVQVWPHGYCEHATSYQSESDGCWFIEISPQRDSESTRSVIDAFMHIGCGFSYVCIDDQDIKSWLSNGSHFRVVTIQGGHTELAFNLWEVLKNTINAYEGHGFYVKGVILTIMGKEIPLDEIDLYVSIVQGFEVDIIPNTCLFFDDQEHGTWLKLHLALQPLEKDNSAASDLDFLII